MLSNFSRKEKILIFILILLMAGLIYYRFIYRGINNARINLQTRVERLQDEVNAANARVVRINKMKEDMDSGTLSKMGSYNNSMAETAFLNTVLSEVPGYSITFDSVTRSGNQIRRNFNLKFTAPSYEQAKSIVKNLTEGEYRCLPGDMSCDIADGGTTTVNMTATFYETMVGGVEDSALPADSASSQQQ